MFGLLFLFHGRALVGSEFWEEFVQFPYAEFPYTELVLIGIHLGFRKLFHNVCLHPFHHRSRIRGCITTDLVYTWRLKKIKLLRACHCLTEELIFYFLSMKSSSWGVNGLDLLNAILFHLYFVLSVRLSPDLQFWLSDQGWLLTVRNVPIWRLRYVKASTPFIIWALVWA